MSLKIAIVTDIHHGKDAEAKKGSQALPLLKKFARFVAKQKPDLVLDLGDRISDEDPETDLRLEEEVSAAFEPIRRVARFFTSAATTIAIFSASIRMSGSSDSRSITSRSIWVLGASHCSGPIRSSVGLEVSAVRKPTSLGSSARSMMPTGRC